MNNKSEKIKDVVNIGISVCLLIISSWIQIPLTIPITLQILSIFVISGIFSFKQSFVSVIIYIVLGIIGLPVFSMFNNGIGVIVGYNGGFIVSFILIPIIVNIFNYKTKDNYKLLFVSFIVSLLMVYILGSIWFMKVYLMNTGTISYINVLAIAVIPFIIPDIIKIVIALIIIRKIKTDKS